MANALAFKGASVEVQLSRAMTDDRQEIAKAVHGAALDMARDIRTKGAADIQKAGNFGPRWTEGLITDVEPKGAVALTAHIFVSHVVPYFDVFQTGATIRGNMWVPFSYTGIKIRARDYARAFGGLFYVKSRAGLPMLFSMKDRKPKYFGINSATHTKRFHIVEIGEAIAGQFDAYYAKRLAKG